MLKIDFVETSVENPGYRVRVITEGLRPFDRFMDFAQESTTLSPADILAVVETMANWIAQCAVDGDPCDLGDLGCSYLSVRGGFDRIPKRIDPDTLKPYISWRLSSRILREFREGVRYERMPTQPLNPIIVGVAGFAGPQTWIQDMWPAGGRLHLVGDNLKFDPSAEDEGVFLRPVHGSSFTRVQLYEDVYPRSVRLTVPEELRGAGALKLEVRRRFTDRNRLARSTYSQELLEITDLQQAIALAAKEGKEVSARPTGRKRKPGPRQTLRYHRRLRKQRAADS